MEEPAGFALRERGLIVRATAATLTAVNTVLLVIGLARPEAFGLDPVVVLGLGLPHLALGAALAAMPWDRILPERPMPWLLRATVGYNIAGLLVALVLARDANTQVMWLIGFHVIYSALILPLREHAIAATAAVAGAAGILLATGGIDVLAAVNLTALVGIALLATIGARVVLAALERAERARHEADTTSAALRQALVAVHATRTGEVQVILDATAEAIARRPGDMAGVYVIDGDDILTAFRGVPQELQRSDPDTVHGIVRSIDERGSAVLDYEGPDADALPPEMAGQLRASMVAPVRRRGHVIGAVTVARPTGPLFTTGERVALELLADHVARGILLSRELETDRAALERLRELDRLKRDFVATVSHEMRTPLTVITGLSETLQQHGETMDEDLRSTLITRLRSNAGTLDRIVTGLLDASGIDRGIIAVQQDDIDLTELLLETAARLESLFDEHDLTTDVAPDLHVAGDPGLLERVLENLLTNAQRHTPPGTTVSLTAAQSRRPGLITVAVVDDGPGIAPDDLVRVLDRFVRGGPPDERPTRGLGLGLALADEVLRLHNSSLEVDSELGAGTTFRFDLAATPAPGPVTPVAGSSRSHP